ncbi:MAG: N4-gp56 family major capsid protein [Nitrospirae bacterium]|nr:N4-gp56 family major capsid protein [Nitrospirota bacterium]
MYSIFSKKNILNLVVLLAALCVGKFCHVDPLIAIGLFAGLTAFSDISPRTTAYADRRLLERAKINNLLDQFGQVRVLPKKASQTIIFRRYNKLDSTPIVLQEGVTPTGKNATKTDVTAVVKQYGDWVGYSDVIEDTLEDPVLQEFTDMLGDQASEMYDKVYAGVLKAGTNVIYGNGAARTDVNTVIGDAELQSAIRVLERQEAKPIRGIVKAGPNIGTNPIPPAFIAVCHSDLRKDLEALAGWTPVHKYASSEGLINGEAGSAGQFRFVFDNNLAPWADGGGAKGGTISTTGVSSDVYPVLVFGKDAYGTVPLAGKKAVSTVVNNPKSITGDELAQRGSIGWKGWTTAVILNDLWMVRIEVAATAL